MKVIGLTGGIGTGKSEVSKILAQLGAFVIDADEVGHEAYLPETETWREVVDAFGEDILKPNKEIDRRRLGAAVFSSPEALQRLNSIVHPRMRRLLEQRIDEQRRRGSSVVVVEAAVLMEAGWTPLIDQVWVVTSETKTVVERLMKGRGLSEEAVMSRIRAQMPPEERKELADVVIQNDDDLASLRESVESQWKNRVLQK